MLQSVNTNCTSDTFVMESVCNDILEQAQQLNPQLMVIAVAIQLSSDKMVKAIQFQSEDCNIVFNVSSILVIVQILKGVMYIDHWIHIDGPFSTCTTCNSNL